MVAEVKGAIKMDIIKRNYGHIILWMGCTYLLGSVYLVQTNASCERLLDVFQWIGFLYAVSVLCTGKMKITNLACVMAVELAFVIGYLHSGIAVCLKYSIFLIAGAKLNWNKLYKKLGTSYCLLSLLVIVLSILKILPAQTVRRGYSTLGFSHSNVLAVWFMTIQCCYILTHFEKMKLLNFAGLLLTILLAYFLTGSRTAVLSMLILWALTIVFKYTKKSLFECKIVWALVLVIPLICFGMSWYVGLCYDPKVAFFHKLNELLTTRPFLAHRFLQRYPLTLFGQRVTTSMVENIYLVALYNWGVIPTGVLMFFYEYAIYRSLKNRSYGQVACLIAFAFHGVAEALAFEPFINVALLSVFANAKTKSPESETGKHQRMCYECEYSSI